MTPQNISAVPFEEAIKQFDLPHNKSAIERLEKMRYDNLRNSRYFSGPFDYSYHPIEME